MSLVALRTAQSGFSYYDRIEYRLYGLAPDGKKVPVSIFSGGECSASELIGEICRLRCTPAICALERTIRGCLDANEWRTVNLSYHDHLLKRLRNLFLRSYDEWLEVRPVQGASNAVDADHSNS